MRTKRWYLSLMLLATLWAVCAWGEGTTPPLDAAGPGPAAKRDALIQQLKDPDAGKRVAAINALGDLHDPQGFPPVITLLRDKAPVVRATAVHILLREKVAVATVQILRRISDGDVSVRQEAVAVFPHALQQMGWEGFVLLALRDKDVKIRLAMLKELAETPALVRDSQLNQAITDTNPTVRSAIAAVVVGQQSLPLMRQWGTRLLNDPTPAVRIASLTTLANGPSPEAEQLLVQTLADADAKVRAHALAVLQQIQATRPDLPNSLIEIGLLSHDANCRNLSRDLLMAISGQAFGEDDAEWRHWWFVARFQRNLKASQPAK